MCYDKLKYDLKMSIKNITLSRAEIIEKIDFQLNLTKNFNFSQKPSYTPYHATISRWELFPLFMNHIVSLYRNSSDFRFQKGPKIKVQHNFCDSFDFLMTMNEDFKKSSFLPPFRHKPSVWGATEMESFQK